MSVNKEPSEILISYERNCKSTINRNNRKRKVEKLEFEIQKIKAESNSKTAKIAELKIQIDSLNQKLIKSEESNKELTDKLQKANLEIERINGLCSNLYQEYAILAKEKDSESMKFEIAQNHMETKIRLLKEVNTYIVLKHIKL